MSEKQPKKIIGAAAIIPFETRITREGTSLFARVDSTSPQARDIAINSYAQDLEAEIVSVKSESEANAERIENGKAFFSSSRWNATWEPTGPTPPWTQKPENN